MTNYTEWVWPTLPTLNGTELVQVYGGETGATIVFTTTQEIANLGGGGGGVAGLTSTGAGQGQTLTYDGSTLLVNDGTGIVFGVGGGGGILTVNDASNNYNTVFGAQSGNLLFNDSVANAAQFQITGSSVYLNPALLPTSDPHAAGQLWNNAGVLQISAG